MDHDALALSGIVLSTVAMIVTLHPLWMLAFSMSFAYGGWRFGQRIMPPEEHGV